MSLTRKVAVNTAGLVAGRVLVVIGGIASVALASRYLGLAEYGALTTAFAFVALFEVFTDFGVYTMASREIATKPESERHIVGNVASLSLSISVVVMAVAWGAAQLLYPGGGTNGEIRQGVTILLVQLAVAAPIGAARAHFVANQRAYLAAFGEATAAAVTVAVTVVAVLLGWGFPGVMAGLASGRVAQAVVMAGAMSREVRGSFAVDRAYWRRLLAISLPLGATLIINYLYFRLDVLLIGWLRDADDVAIYGLAYKVIEAFIVLPSYFMITLFPEIARMGADSERLRSVMGQALAVMETLALPIVVLTVPLAGPIVRLIGGTQFEDAAPVLQILMIGLAVSFVNGVYGNALVALGRQSRLFWLSLLVLGVNVVLNLIAIPIWGVVGAAAAVSASEVVAFLVVRRLYATAATLPTNERRGRVLLAGVAMVVSVAWVPWAPLGDIPLVLVAGVVGIAVYGGALIALRALPEVVETQLLAPLLRSIRSR